MEKVYREGENSAKIKVILGAGESSAEFALVIWLGKDSSADRTGSGEGGKNGACLSKERRKKHQEILGT